MAQWFPAVTFAGKWAPVAPAAVTASATLTSGSATATLADTSAIAGAVGVSGSGIAPGTLVASVDSATQITLTANATASGVKSLTFSLEPVTLAQAKAHLRVTHTYDDGYIAALITAARLRAESETDRVFLTSAWDYSVERFPMIQDDVTIWKNVTNVLVIPKASLLSVTSIKYIAYDESVVTMDPVNYRVRTGDPGAVFPTPFTRIWPLTRPTLDAVTVRCVLGYGATADSVPATVKQAVMMLVSQWYENREATADRTQTPVPLTVGYLLADASWGNRP